MSMQNSAKPKPLWYLLAVLLVVYILPACSQKNDVAFDGHIESIGAIYNGEGKIPYLIIVIEEKPEIYYKVSVKNVSEFGLSTAFQEFKNSSVVGYNIIRSGGHTEFKGSRVILRCNNLGTDQKPDFIVKSLEWVK